MATRPVNYEQVFWQSRVSAAFRTGWACFMVGVMMQYSNMHNHWMAFPVFAYVMTVTVVGESSLGEALRASCSVLAGTVNGVCPTIVILWLIKPVRFSLWVTTVCVTVSSFIIAYPKATHITSKRVAFAQIVIIYISAFMMRESMNAVTYPLRVAGTTALGAACAVLALILPIPKLACYQVQEKSKLSARITSEVLTLLVEAFRANDYKEANSLCFQAKSLSTAGVSILKQVEDKQVDIKWELPGLGCRPTLRVLSKDFSKLKQSLVGMEMALKSSSPSQNGDTLHMWLKDPLLYLTEWTSLALKHAGSSCMRTSAMRTHMELIMEEGKEALNSFDEALSVVIQRVYYSNEKPTTASKPNAVLDDQPQANSEDLADIKSSFAYHLPSFFFLFSMKLLCKEAIDILPCLASSAEKMQQVAPMSQPPDTNSNPETAQRSDYCRQCAVPLRTAISINIDASQDHQQVQVSKFDCIRQFFKRLGSLIDTNRLIIALKCSLALGLSALFGILFSNDRGYWAGIAVAISMGTSREATFKLANVRAQGTVAGSVYGVIASVLTQKFILLRVIALIPWVVFTSFLRQSKMYGYAGGVSAFIAAVIILGRKNADPPSEFAIVRITETFIGIACYILVELLLQPRRASTLARNELVLSLNYLQNCTHSFISAQTSHLCVHSCSSALVELKEKEKRLQSHISRLRAFIEEAKVEPDFWFLPFPGDTYSKLLESHSKITDLLHFAIRSFETIIEISSSNHVSIDRIYGPIRDDLAAFESRVSAAFQCFREVVQIKSLRHIIRTQNRISHDNEQNITFPADVESGGAMHHESHASVQINRELQLPMNAENITTDDHDEEYVIHSLVQNFQKVVADLCLADPEEINFNNELVLSFSALAFCLEGIMEESKELEKSIHELLQWENPWSLIDVWELHSILKTRGQSLPRPVSELQL
eukprot:Gb_26774 [translate_table: standard]